MRRESFLIRNQRQKWVLSSSRSGLMWAQLAVWQIITSCHVWHFGVPFTTLVRPKFLWLHLNYRLDTLIPKRLRLDRGYAVECFSNFMSSKTCRTISVELTPMCLHGLQTGCPLARRQIRFHLWQFSLNMTPNPKILLMQSSLCRKDRPNTHLRETRSLNQTQEKTAPTSWKRVLTSVFGWSYLYCRLIICISCPICEGHGFVGWIAQQRSG